MRAKQLQNLLVEPQVEFNEEKHSYTARDGSLYTGCTTISDAWDKSSFLGPWHAKEMFLEAKARIGDIAKALQDNPRPDAALEILEECKGAAKRKSEAAKVSGKLAHEWIEHAIASKIDPSLKKLPLPKDEDAKNAVNAFAYWARGKNIVWLASEEVVFSHKHRIAGTLDAIAVIDGITYLVDFKTSSQISPSYLLQCAGYDLMLDEMGFKVSGYLVLRIPKDGHEPEVLAVTNRTDMDFFKETFLKQREAHKFYVFMEGKYKDLSTGKMKTEKVAIPKDKINNKNQNVRISKKLSKQGDTGGKA